MTFSLKHAGAAALGLGLALGACSMPTNRSLNSLNQPVVERQNFTLDVAAGPGGLSVPEQQRVAGWFEAMDLSYGDRVSIEDPGLSPATRASIAELAGRHGIMVAEAAPVTPGTLPPGTARVVVTRSVAYVPDCPNWSAKSDLNYANAIYPNYGCAVNGNLAAMVADPQDLIRGQEGTGEVLIGGGTKAIDAYREQPTTGQGGLTQTASSGE